VEAVILAKYCSYCPSFPSAHLEDKTEAEDGPGVHVDALVVAKTPPFEFAVLTCYRDLEQWEVVGTEMTVVPLVYSQRTGPALKEGAPANTGLVPKEELAVDVVALYQN
jgi:hypothetical protein